MEILSRHQLLAMAPEQLRATAECHGLDLEEIPQSQWVDVFDEHLSFWRDLQGA